MVVMILLMSSSRSFAGEIEARLADSAVSITQPEKVVLLDCHFNNEWRKDSAGIAVRYHYVWQDTTNSGFSILGGIIRNAGASLDTLSQSPSVRNLANADIYIIVDPDTPKETVSPNYIDNQSIDAIVQWVKDGGVLMLMGNDKGNAEFEHFNRLADQFGVHFNEDSRNRVAGKEYGVGAFDSFPDHPLFKGVNRIFVKELSTLKIQKPATEVLAQGGDVIMALSRVGKGAVFAIGDPWLYNEYMDQRRLPADYDNARAAENLFRWLLAQTQE